MNVIDNNLQYCPQETKEKNKKTQGNIHLTQELFDGILCKKGMSGSLDFSSLLQKRYENTGFDEKRILYSIDNIQVGYIEYKENGENILLDVIVNINNNNDGDTDYWGTYFASMFGVTSEIPIPGLGTHMFLDFIKSVKDDGLTKISFVFSEGAEGFYDHIIDTYNGIYFNFSKDESGYYVFNLI